MSYSIFIDGEAGTTGLDVLRRLEAHLAVLLPLREKVSGEA